MSSVLFLAPEIYSAHGGVQAYMLRLAEILSAYAEGAHSMVHCVTLADSTGSVDGRHLSYARFTPAQGHKLRFIWNAAKAAILCKPSIAVVGHVALGPVALALQFSGLISGYVVVLHGREAWMRLSWAKRVAARHAREVVSTTEYTARTFCQLNDIAYSRARVIPLAIPEAAAGAEPGPGPSTQAASDLRVLTVGRLVQAARYKGIDTLIEAVARMRSSDRPVRLTVAGDGDDLPALRRQAENQGVTDRVSFVGAVPDAELTRLYRECDVFALPSEKEGFGIVFLEAMASGKPCIGGNHGGTPEVIHDGENGFLIKHGDTEALTRRLQELAADSALRKRMGEKARHTVEERYRFPRMRDDWFSLLGALRH